MYAFLAVCGIYTSNRSVVIQYKNYLVCCKFVDTSHSPVNAIHLTLKFHCKWCFALWEVQDFNNAQFGCVVTSFLASVIYNAPMETFLNAC